MSKRFSSIFLVVLPICAMITSAFLLLEPSTEPHAFLPSSGGNYYLGKEEGENETEEQKRRLAWIEQIHRAAPGTDWRAIDRQTRLKKYKAWLKKAGEKSGGPVSIAGGVLTGVWKEKGSNNLAGRTHTADYDTSNGKIYLASDGGNIWRGSLTGAGWEVLNDQLKFESVELVRVIHREGSKRILVGTNDRYIYYSDDDGASWQTSTGLPLMTSYYEHIERVQVCDDSLATVLVLLQGHVTGQTSKVQLYRSIDRGATFTPYMLLPNVGNGDLNQFDLWLPQYGNSKAYVVHNDQSYSIDLSNDNLDTLGVLPGIPQGYTMLTGHLANNGTVYLYAYVNQLVFRSADNGATWAQKSDLGSDPFFKTSFNCAVNTPDVLFFGDIELHRSTNGGTSWTIVNNWADYYQDMISQLHADNPAVNCLRKADGSEFQLINTDGGTYISNNNVLQVSNISLSGLNVGQYYSSLTARYDTNYVYIGAQDQGFQRADLDNGGLLHPEQVISGDYGHIVSGNDGYSIFMVYPGFAMFFPDASSNANFTWDFDGSNTFWIPPLMADPDYDDICYMANGNKLTKLQPSGSSLGAENLLPLFNGSVSSMAVSPLNHDYWYVLTDNGKFYRSVDRGETWVISSISNAPDGHYLYGACVYPSRVNLGEVWISGSGYSNPPVYFTSDNGATFTSKSNGLPSTLVYKIDGTPADEFLFAATEVGAYVYIKSEAAWFDLGDGVSPDQNYWSVDYIASMKTARFVTYGRGVWDFKLQTPLALENVPSLKATLSPNPASSLVNVNLTSVNEPVNYQLFDISGKQVMNGKITSATASLSVNQLGNGMYLLVMWDNSRRTAEKLIIRH